MTTNLLLAKRPKLSDKQRRQIARNRRKKHLATVQGDAATANTSDLSLDATRYGPLQAGKVVSRFGKQAIVRDSEGVDYQVHIRRTIDSVVCGDQVQFYPPLAENNQDLGVIEFVAERHSVLTRPDFYDGVKPIAANIDQIIIVSAILPTLSTHIIDRYLVACEDVAITPVIVINKIELIDDEDRDLVDEALDIYREIGYRVLYTSCKTQEGIAELSALLGDKISVFVGQSGVGKSSLVNALLPESDEVVGAVSSNSGLGTHTTTAAKLIPFKHGGELIDSPGVREFALWHLPPEQITQGFVEFRPFLGGCKFRDCKHRDDPGCLLRKAVEDGVIDEERFLSYHKILDSMSDKRPSFASDF